MTAKEYLSQTWRIDRMINAKIKQVQSLRELSTNATATMSMTSNGNRNIHRMEDIIVKIIDLENEINADIDDLVDLKRDIVHMIKNIENPDYMTLLELRYLCFMTWSEIAFAMQYSKDNIFKLHQKALAEISLQ